MAQIVLVTGGARSGKSAIAEGKVLGFGAPAVYIATAQAFDAEMEARIATHQARRGPEWRTHAEPLELCAALAATDGAPRLVDCLTLWLSNLILGERDLEAAAVALETALAQRSAPAVLVSNEVGLGIVPENALARRFRDAAGILHQRLAERAERVVFTVAGIPMVVK